MGEAIIAKENDDNQQSNNFECQVAKQPQQLDMKIGKNTILLLLIKNAAALCTIKITLITNN